VEDSINLAEKFALLGRPYEPGIIGYLNDYVRHEALSDRVGCKAPPPGCRSGPVKLRAA